MFNGDPAASETMPRLPLTAPAAVGANFTLNVTVWLGVRVVGKASPVTENPAPVTFACEMVTFAPPVLVSVSDRLALLPTCTLPKDRLVGLADSAPALTPVPETAMFRVGL